MKKFYEIPEVEAVVFNASDVIAASGNMEDTKTDDDPNGGWGGFQ